MPRLSPAPALFCLLAACVGRCGDPGADVSEAPTPDPRPHPEAADAVDAAEAMGRLRPRRSGWALRLYEALDDAEITLPSGENALRLPARHPLTRWRPMPGQAAPGASLWAADSPARLPASNAFASPAELTLWRGDERLPFCNLPSAEASDCWDLKDGLLWLAAPGDPGATEAPPALEIHGVAEAAARMDPAASGLPPRQFVRGELTLGGDTRPGLWLPAPAEIRWPLTLPEGARLTLHAAIAPAPLRDQRSDGATLEVALGDTPLATLTLTPGDPLRPLELDLSNHAGPAELRLRTLPGGDDRYDYVFVGAPTLSAPGEAPPRRVVVVGVDTLRFDALSQHHYGRDTSAPLDDFASGAVLFERAWTPAPRTRPSFQSALTGRWPGAAGQALTLGERLARAGFATAGFAANVHLQPRFGFHRGADLWRYRSRRPAGDQLQDALGWLRERGDRDAYAFVHLIDPHLPYEPPVDWQTRYGEADPGPIQPTMNRWEVLDLVQSGQAREANLAWLRQRYDAEIRYLSEALAGFLAEVEALEGDTLVVLFSDHGEEFWDHGGFEHNHTLYDELTRAVLWIRPPGGLAGGPRRLAPPVGTVDLVPTVCDLLGVPAGELDGRSLAGLFQGTEAGAAEALRQRPLALGHLMYDLEQWGVVYGGHKYTLETATGRERLYNLEADPREQRDLAPDAPPASLAGWRALLERATGHPAGWGWRVEVKALREPLVLRFSAPVRAAAVLDPEAASRRRANVAWGEVPDVLPEEIGQVALSEDRRLLILTPGPYPDGTLGVILEDPRTTAELALGSVVRPERRAGTQLDTPAGAVSIEAGAVILPGAGEDEVGGAAEDDLEELRALGYVE